jgi:serine/threonine protein kinase
MEYLGLGDLEGYLQNPLSHIEARQITKQLLEGLEFMHNSDFAHRDLKPSVSS